MGQRLEGRGCATHGLLLRAGCRNPEATSPRLFPVHRLDAAVVTGQSGPNSGGRRDGLKLKSRNALGFEDRYHVITSPQAFCWAGTRSVHKITFRRHSRKVSSQIKLFFRGESVILQ